MHPVWQWKIYNRRTLASNAVFSVGASVSITVLISEALSYSFKLAKFGYHWEWAPGVSAYLDQNL